MKRHSLAEANLFGIAHNLSSTHPQILQNTALSTVFCETSSIIVLSFIRYPWCFMLKLILPGKYETFTVPERQKGRLGLQQKNSCLDCAETPLHDEDSFLQ